MVKVLVNPELEREVRNIRKTHDQGFLRGKSEELEFNQIFE